MGLGVSTGHPLGIVAAAGMPLACLTPGTRKAAFKSTLGYYVAGLWPMVPGLDRYIGQSATSLIPYCDLGPRRNPALGAMDDRVDIGSLRNCLWRAPLALAGNDRPSARDHRPCFAAHSGGLPFSRNGLGRPRGGRAPARDCSLDARVWPCADVALFCVSLVGLCRRTRHRRSSFRSRAMLSLLADGLR